MAEIIADGDDGQNNIQDAHWTINDHVTSNMFAEDDYFSGWGASYTVSGGDGNDKIVTGRAGGTAHGDAGNDSLWAITESALYTNNMYGDAGDDNFHTFFDREGQNNLYGGGGVDYFLDNHSLGGDLYDGGADFDWVVTGESGPVTIVMGGTSSGGTATGNHYSNIEGILATNGNDAVTGSSANNVFVGRGGSDTLNGAGGKDLLIGATYNGFFEEFTNTRGHFASNAYSYTDSSGYNSSSLEDDGAADALNGGEGDDTLLGGLGADVLDGGGGARDLAAYFDSTVGVTVNLATNAGTGGTAAGDTFFGVEDILGSAFADRLTGNGAVNILRGGGGNDILNGGAEADQTWGGAGDDTYYVDNRLDRTTEQPGEGTDTVYSSVARTLNENIEILRLTGTEALGGAGNAAANQIYGNAGDNLLQGLGENDALFGGGGNDTLKGDAGDDTMSGQAGDDTYYVDAAADKTVEDFDQGIDTVYSSVGRTLNANIEILRLTGVGDLSGKGNDLANQIYGNAGANLLQGLGAGDTLRGGNGDDRLLGGEGNDLLFGENDDDTLEGGAGNDTLAGGAGADTYRFAGATGTDKIAGFETALDRFDLAGGLFTARTESAGNTRLTHAGGSIVVSGVTGLSLDDWNGLVAGGARHAPFHDATPPTLGHFGAADFLYA